MNQGLYVYIFRMTTFKPTIKNHSTCVHQIKDETEQKKEKMPERRKNRVKKLGSSNVPFVVKMGNLKGIQQNLPFLL